MSTLRDALNDAFARQDAGEAPPSDAPPIDTAEAAPIDDEPSSGPARGADGRFTKAEQKEAEQAAQSAQAAPAATPANPAAAPATRKVPSSWAKDYWDDWGKLDPKIQEYIEKREADYAKGVSTYKSQWDQVQPINEVVQKFAPELQRFGIQPAQWIRNLGDAHRALALGSPEQKMQMFVKLATDYGVPIQSLVGGQQADPQFGHITQTLSQIQQEFNTYKAQQEQAQQAQLQKQIEDFKAAHPHFEAVSQSMTGLLQSGMAHDLQSAYDKAVRLHDDVWQQIQADKQAEIAAQRQAELAKKKATAVSPRSTSPTGSTSASNGKKSLRDTLSEQFDSVSGGRF